MSAPPASVCPSMARGPRTVELLVVGVALLIGGQALLLSEATIFVALPTWLIGIGALLVAAWPVLPRQAHTLPVADGPRRLRPHQRGLLAGAGAACVAVGLLVHGRPEDHDFTAPTLAWVVAMVMLVVAAWDPRRRPADRERPAAWEAWGLLGVVVVAGLIRVVGLDRFPTLLDADGYSQALEARAIRDGLISSPFTTGFFDNPVLFSYLQRGALAVFGDTAEGAMALGVIAGTGTVAVTVALARRLAGPVVAVMAGGFLAAAHAHVHFSRSSLNIVEDAFWLVSALLLLDIAIVDRRRWAAALGGVTIGLSQYFYFSGRLVPPLAASVLLWSALRGRREGIGGVGGTAAWVVAGALVAFLPLGLHYLDQPEDYTSRLNTVSFVAGLDGLQEKTGEDAPMLIARQVRSAALLAFETPQESTFFHPRPPLIGWSLAPLAAVGVALVTVAPGRRRQATLALWWWGAAAGVGMTISLHAQRWLVAWPLVAIAAALGLEAVGRVPVMGFRSHSTLRFLSPHVVGDDVLEPMRSDADVPPVTGRTVFVFLSDRLGELDVVRAAAPGGTTEETHDRRGSLLYVTYQVDP